MNRHAAPECTLSLTARPFAPAVARDLVGHALSAWGHHPDRIFDAMLVTGELVTGMVTAAPGQRIGFRCSTMRGAALLECHAHTCALPADPRALTLIAAYAHTYNILPATPTTTGTIWALMPT